MGPVSDIRNPDSNQIASPKFTIDCEIEQSEIPGPIQHLQPNPYGPDLLLLEWGLLTYQFALIPGNGALGGSRFLYQIHHDLLPPKSEDSGVVVSPSLLDDSVKPDLDDLEVPVPGSSVVSELDSSVSDLSSDASSSGSGGHVLSCGLCGSEVMVPDGQSSAECPLCGEMVSLS